MDMKFKRGAAGVLAGVTMLGLTGCGISKSNNDNNADAARIAELEQQIAILEDIVRKDDRYDYQGSTESSVGQIERVEYDYTEYAKKLYQETIEKNAFVTRYAPMFNVKWNEDLALEVVELWNGVYPTRMQQMSQQNAYAEMQEVKQAIDLLLAGNLNNETKDADVIRIWDYIANENEEVVVENAMGFARSAMVNAYGEPFNGREMGESEWGRVNKFSERAETAIDAYLRYADNTVRDPQFFEMNAGAQYLIADIFYTVDSAIVQPWNSYIAEKSEFSSRENERCYRYFIDDYRKLTYWPEPDNNGNTIYVARDENCVVIESFTEPEMLAMAGLSYVAESRNTGITPNPNIHIDGIGQAVDQRVAEASEALDALTAQKVYTIK